MENLGAEQREIDFRERKLCDKEKRGSGSLTERGHEFADTGKKQRGNAREAWAVFAAGVRPRLPGRGPGLSSPCAGEALRGGDEKNQNAGGDPWSGWGATPGWWRGDRKY